MFALAAAASRKLSARGGARQAPDGPPPKPSPSAPPLDPASIAEAAVRDRIRIYFLTHATI